MKRSILFIIGNLSFRLELKREKIIVKGLMLLAVLLLTVRCSDDDVVNRHDDATVELFPYVSGYTDIEPIDAHTRAVTPTTPSWAPENYFDYNTLNGVEGLNASNEDAFIGVFFTHGTTTEEIRRFGRKHTGEWNIFKEAVDLGDYQLYGYVPYDVGTFGITYNGESYADGAVLTLSGVNGVLNQDICVIVGAKDGTKVGENNYSFYEGRPLVTGNFDCKYKSVENYIFLLFDHLCSALRFRFRVDYDYAQLRSIKLKKLDLSAYSDAACLTPVKKLNATITLQKTNDGSSPIVDGVVFTPDPDDNSVNTYKVSIYSGEEGEVDLPYAIDQYTDYLGFAPVTNATNYYMLHSTYDVYDRKGNLIRKNCVATNKIDIRELFNLSTGMKRGHVYTLRLIVKPTYLYVLSEPDLDSPTVTVE